MTASSNQNKQVDLNDTISVHSRSVSAHRSKTDDKGAESEAAPYKKGSEDESGDEEEGDDGDKEGDDGEDDKVDDAEDDNDDDDDEEDNDDGDGDDDDDDDNDDDNEDVPLSKLPPELRFKVYDYIFDWALDEDEPLDREKCCPVPSIVLAWPELEEECRMEWKERLYKESFRLQDYQIEIDEADRKCFTLDGAELLYEEFERTYLKQKQVEWLISRERTGSSCTGVFNYCHHRSLMACACQQPWPLNPWSDK